MNPENLPVPPAVAARARRLAAGTHTPVVPRPASTVVLLRDSALGLQVYVLRRRTTMAFAPGMYAFPGGSVDARDAATSVRWAGPPPEAWAARLGLADAAAARASVCAAARELFEETGVLLAGPGPTEVVADTTGDDYEEDRRALLGRVVSFADLLRRRDLVLRSDLLEAAAHWVTPEAEERRFDTRFYLAALPAGQRTRDVSGEADRVAWMRPIDAEAAVHAGEMRMLPPTAAMLAALVPFASVAAALAAARTWTLTPVCPAVEFDGDTPRWKLYGNAVPGPVAEAGDGR
jgi:8-oxo-dGTP pyrophosphatase MutT (NUDIX family)